MTLCNPGDIVLVRFPFTDRAAGKKRPAVVLSPPAYSNRYGDIVLLALTSRPQADTALRLVRWQEAGLPRPTWLKALIATVNIDVVVRCLGHLHEEDRPKVSKAIGLTIATPFLPPAQASLR